ncbi:MAG: hypothetical protein U0U69_10330 [Acidimicrobiia bacterium]
MGTPRRAAADPLATRRRRLLSMHLRLGAIRDVDWVAASYGHA